MLSHVVTFFLGAAGFAAGAYFASPEAAKQYLRAVKDGVKI